MKYKFNDLEYELIKNYRDGFDFEEIELRLTDYFYEYDYIFGDWAYGKLRLKGFFDSDNKNVKKYRHLPVFFYFLFFLNSSKDTTRPGSGTVPGFSSNGNSISLSAAWVCVFV